MTLLELQRWLAQRGAPIACDGVAGPQTRAAILSVFANPVAPAVTSAEIAAIAARLTVSEKQVRTVATVESGGSGFTNSGLPKILWERHHFWKRTAGRFGITRFSNPRAGDYTLDADRNGINDSWEKLALAACKSPMRAFESCSWGKFQIMGWHAVPLGYPSALDMAWQMSRTEGAHYDALARFIQVNGLVTAMRKLSADPEDCRAFASRYNGAGYRRFSYHEKLAREMAR